MSEKKVDVDQTPQGDQQSTLEGLAATIRQARRSGPSVADGEPPTSEGALGEGNDSPQPAGGIGELSISFFGADDSDNGADDDTPANDDAPTHAIAEPAPASDQVQPEVDGPSQAPAQEQDGDAEGAHPVPAIVSMLKEDDRLRRMVGAYLVEGDVEAARVLDIADQIDDMDDDTVIRHAVALESGERDPDVIEVMVRSRMRSEGITDDVDEELEAKLKRSLARKYRAQIKKRAEGLKERIDKELDANLSAIESPPTQEQAVPEEVEQVVKAVRAFIERDPTANMIRTNKAYSVYVGGEEVKLPVGDPDEVLEAPFNGFVPLLMKLFDDQGMPDMRKLAMVMSLLDNPEAFIRQFVGVGRTLTLKELRGGLPDNQQTREPAGAPVGEKDSVASLAEAIRRAKMRK